MTLPKVSVLLPVCDREVHLDPCLVSLIKQHYSDFEIIAVHDGTSRAVLTTLQTFQKQFKLFKLIQPGRVGLIAALNKGLQACQGRYIARMDADDICRLDRLQIQAEALDADPNVTLVSCRTTSFPQAAIAKGFRLYEKWLNGLETHKAISDNMFIESPFAHPTVMFRKDVVMQLGGYRDHGLPEDYDLWLRLYQSGARFQKIPKSLLAWRMHKGRHSFNHDRYHKNAFLKLKVAFLVQQLPKQLTIIGGGPLGRFWAKTLINHKITIRAMFDIDPRKIGKTVNGISIQHYLKREMFSRTFSLIAVGSRGQRQLIRKWLLSESCKEGQDFLFVA